MNEKVKNVSKIKLIINIKNKLIIIKELLR